jgi:hypothetical protein
VKTMSKKTFVVILTSGRKHTAVRDQLIVKAENEKAAISSAKAISVRVKGKCIAIACEADPVTDLGCLTRSEVAEMHAQVRRQIVERSERIRANS